MIKRFQNDDQLSDNNKAKCVAEFRVVEDYCTNLHSCRRVQVLQYFGEELQDKGCDNNCDVCQSGVQFTTSDFTTEAIAAVTLFKSMTGNRTLNYCRAVFMGRKKKDIFKLGHYGLPGYGRGKALGDRGTKSLFQALITMGVLREIAISNSSGYPNNYVQVS